LRTGTCANATHWRCSIAACNRRSPTAADNNARLFGSFVLLPDALQRRAIELQMSFAITIFAACKTPTTTCAQRAAAAAATFWPAVALWRTRSDRRRALQRGA
jgi:hypothetical protein